MDIYSILSLLGGLALFLYGMTAMSNGLEKMAGGKLEIILKKLTSNKLRGLALGAGVTAIIQSSSAVTVMLVGLVNSGVMKLSQAISVIMGSNVGTTMTAWLLSLTGIKSGNIFLNLLKPIHFSPILALIGIILIMASKREKRRDAGGIMIGFAILMFGMDMMSSSVEPLADSPAFVSMLTAFSNPVLGVIVGMVFTAIIQSSSASVGVLQALSMTGSLTYMSAVPIIMGQNIGTCVSALLASLGTNKSAKRVATVHVLFNVIGTVVFLTIWTVILRVVDLKFATEAAAPYNIAIIHSIFNIAATVVLFPFINAIEKLACLIVKDTDEKEVKALLDERLMTVPAIATSKAFDVTVDMAHDAKMAVEKSILLMDDYSIAAAEQIEVYENKTDRYEDELGTYLLKLSATKLSEADGNTTSKLLHTISDFERIADHAQNLSEVAAEIDMKKIVFSDTANAELKVLYAAINEILSITINAFASSNLDLAKTVEPLEQVVDDLTTEIKSRHIKRLQSGSGTIEIGFILNDMLTNFERISDHCSNIAVAVIESERGKFDTHGYLDGFKSDNNAEFAEHYESFEKKYALQA